METNWGVGVTVFQSPPTPLAPDGVRGRYHPPSIFGEFSNLAENKKNAKVTD